MTAKLGLIHRSCRCHKTHRSAGHSKGKEMGWDGLCLVLGEVHLSGPQGAENLNVLLSCLWAAVRY